MEVRDFGKLRDGRHASLFILRNADGTSAAVTDFGAALVSLRVADKDGLFRDVVLGYDDVSGYEAGQSSLGATVGRFANRIGGARFAMNGKTYELTANNGPNALHGGCDHYVSRLWETRIPFGKINTNEIYKQYAVESLNDRWPAGVQKNITGDAVTFCLDSPDGDQGFPGDLHIEVTYTLTGDNELHIDYLASLADSGKDAGAERLSTPLNLTNHSYFNLNGHNSGDVYEQIVKIEADKFTPNDKWSLPTGELRAVEGTPMDFTSPKKIGQDIHTDDEQIEIGCGYDHNFVLRGEMASDGMCSYRECASLYSPQSGIRMRVLTDLPGMQLYTGNFLGEKNGKGGAYYGTGNGVCFETQFWPDSVNREEFPGGVLQEGRVFSSRTTYAFSCR